MAQRNPVLIARQYVQLTEPPSVRKNALTALAALDDPEGWAVLADTALTDPDESVRYQAEEELSRLPSQSARKAIEPVLAMLEVPQKGQQAYALLGRLRNRGMEFRLPPLNLFSRLKLAKALRNDLYPKRGFFFHMRTVKAATLGTLLAWAGTVVFCAALQDIHLEASSVMGYLILGWIIAILLTMIATIYAAPARSYADIIGGALLDIIAAAAAVEIFFVAMMLIRAFSKQRLIAQDYELIIIGPLAGASVRAGTLAAFGIVRKPWANRLLELVVGGLCGLAVFNLALLHASSDTLLGNVWLMTLPVSFGLAAGFAGIDSQSTLLPVVSRQVRIGGLVFAAIALLPPLTLLVPPRVTETAIGSVVEGKPVQIEHLPANIKFETSRASQLRATFLDRSYDDFSLWKQANDRETAVTWTNMSEAKLLDSGSRYRLSISGHEGRDVSIDDALLRMSKEMSWSETRKRLARESEIAGKITLTWEPPDENVAAR
jgi:hypothetical protein